MIDGNTNNKCCESEQTQNHSHSHSHDHSHAHSHLEDISGKRLFWVIVLNLAITTSEVVGGVISGSLSLISDALHNLSDAAAVVISYIAIQLGKKSSSLKHTFGLKRAEILAALLNSAVLVGVSIYLFYEAIKKFYHPEPIAGGVMLIIAIIGLCGNILSIFLLESGSRENLNIRSAYLHMLSDAISSVAVILGALGIIYFKIYWIDPMLTILIGVYVLKESFGILKNSVHILMEGVPINISLDEIKEKIESIEDVLNVHHIHLWQIGEKEVHIEMHVDLKDMMLSKTEKIRKEIEQLMQMYGINHVTVQFETDCCENKNILCNRS
ncbi:cation diffusion facilitator family transporter [Calditerrivibrio nitroreducens]|uniref:Cation diffusion facilitator family transporter n=1 Tax=Calditerrivibrio nitroreducens (strain DSM 19672 / NBRC 101217 / Yu37-1) TaxID=768670 RepID=E4TJ53_CALNY|nr:cation diffusion facilitator family transporter [Calditerrivibrio nitroreducens]ADR18089.1 cation diffusion facilitator family transporter [Calditerrivibrio nitroreducens DSM 19672]